MTSNKFDEIIKAVKFNNKSNSKDKFSKFN